MKTILVTGGAGFLGSNFVRFIFNKYDGYNVIVLDALTYAGSVENLPKNEMDDSRFSFWCGDVRNAELVNSLVSQSDMVVHMAAETHVTRSIYDNLKFFETDVLGTQIVTNAVLKHMSRIERLVHISTSEVYGTAINEKMNEEHPLKPMSPYAAAKTGADRLIYSYWNTYGIPAIIMRPFNIYGPYQHLEKVIPRFITSCILNEPLMVHGDGKAMRDWLYVEDFCEALDKILHTSAEVVKGQELNIGSGISCSIEDIAFKVVQKMSRPKELIQYIGDRPGQVFRQTASIEKAKSLLNWCPKIDFDKGLDLSIKWYEDNKKWWEKQLWMRAVPIITKSGKKELH